MKAASTKLVTVAGSSVRNGKWKARTSDQPAKVRGKQLLKSGNTEIVLFPLPWPMVKQDAHKYVAANQNKGMVPSFRG